MDPLTKVLVKDLLEAENKKITAIYGGGFKPPTKGHFEVVAKAAEQNPEIDEFIIYVGGGVRDGIGQAESIMIWELYKKHLPLKVRVEAVKAPVGDILRYAKEHPEETVLWVIGARENNPEDFADIASRTRTLDKYPNLELRVIQTAGGVSGTAARKAVRDNNKEQFFHLIPDIEEKNQVWDIVSPIIKENIFKDLKGVLKSIWSKGGKLTQDIIDGAKREGKETSKLVQLLNKMLSGDSITNDEKTFMKAQGKDLLKILPLVAIQGIPLPIPITPLLLVLGKKFGFNILPDSHEVMPLSNLAEVGEANLKPYKWEEVDQDFHTTYITFVTPAETKYYVDLTYTEIDDPEDEDISMEAMSVEFSAKPKGADGSSSKIVVNKGEMYTVMSTIADIIKHYLRKSRGDIKAILYSPSKKGNEDFGSQRDNLYKAFISKALPGAKFFKQGEYSIAYLPGNAIVSELVTDTEIICDNCGWEWEIADGGDDLYICHKCGHDNNPDLAEGRKKKSDPKKGTGKKPEGSGRRLYTDEDPKDTVRIKFKTKEDIVDTLNKKQFKAKSHARQSQVINLIHQRVRAAYGKAKDPEVKSRLKRALDYIESRKESSKEKTERLRKMKEASDPQAGTALPYGSGFAPLEEGRYDSIARQLAKYTINGWKDDAQSGEPTGRVEFEIGPGKDLEYKDLQFLYKGVAVFAGIQTYSHNGYAKLKSGEVGVTYSIPKSMLPQGWEEIYMDLISTIRHEIEHLTQGGINLKPGKEILDTPLRRLVSKHPDTLRYLLLPSEKDANIQGLYLKAKKWKRPYSEVVDEYIRDFLKITDKNDVAILKGLYNKRAQELNLPAIQENDPFGINAYARELVNEALKDTWNPEESFLSLSKFMIDNGMKIQPLPKVKIISDDEENASDFLGKTAYYNPNDRSITLYTKDRHPKDICRSFSHEMVHHEQNLDGRLNNINTTNTNEDGALPEIEREAYEKGNMMFRNWEDSIKNV